MNEPSSGGGASGGSASQYPALYSLLKVEGFPDFLLTDEALGALTKQQLVEEGILRSFCSRQDAFDRLTAQPLGLTLAMASELLQRFCPPAADGLEDKATLLQHCLPQPGPGVEDSEDEDSFEGKTDALRALPGKVISWKYAPGSANIPLAEAITLYVEQEDDPTPRFIPPAKRRRQSVRGNEENAVLGLDEHVLSCINPLLPPGWKWKKLTIGASAEMLKGVLPPAPDAAAGPSLQSTSAPAANPAAVKSTRKLTPDYVLRKAGVEGGGSSAAIAEGGPADGSSWPARILEILSVGEVKRWSKLMRGGAPVNIVQLFNPSSSDALSRSVVRIITQLWTYMLATGVEFGFLSCIGATWLVCRPRSDQEPNAGPDANPDDQLLVSEPFLHSVAGDKGVTVLAALSWLQDQAMQRTHAEQKRHAFKRISITQEQEGGDATQTASMADAGAVTGSGEVFSPGSAVSGASEHPAKRPRTRANTKLGHADPSSSTPDVPSSGKPSAPSSSKPDAPSSSEHKVDIPVLPSHALHLGGATLGMGSSCEVVRGAYLGTEAAVKLLDCSDPWEAAVQEGAMYQVLPGLQGGVIPRLFGIGRVAGFPFIAVSLVEGVPLSQLPGSISRGVQDAAQAALRRVHEQGVAHNDIQLANLMLRRHAGAGPEDGVCAGCEVVLVDLGRAYKCNSRATLDGEMAALRRLLRG